jgi:hypothetical protein
MDALLDRPKARSAPLTVQQEWLWGMVQQYRTWNFCLYTFALRLSGPLNVELLRKSLETLVRRHGALRTRIVSVDGQARQQIDEVLEYHLEVVSFRNNSQSQNEVSARSYIDDLFTRRIDRGDGHLFEVRLLKLADRVHVLALAIHHIISDAFSLSLMFRELWLLYAELSQGHRCSLTGSPPQYADYASWQRKGDCDWRETH